MHLRRISIENYRAIRRLKVRFEDGLGRIRPVTVLAGPNGCGKTSILYAVVQALRGAMGYRTDEVPLPHNDEIHSSAETGGLSPTPPSIAVNLDLEFSEQEIDAIPKVFDQTRELQERALKVPRLQDGRLHVTWKYPPGFNHDGTRRSPAYIQTQVTTGEHGGATWLKGAQFAVRGWRQKRLQDISLLESVGMLKIFPQDRGLIERVIGAAEEFDDTEEPASSGPLGGPKANRSDLTVRDILEYFSSYALSRREQGLAIKDDWERRIQDLFARICSPKEYLGYMYPPNDPVGAPYFQDGATPYPLRMASSGEHIILDYLTNLTYPRPFNHSLILIDEPELHLHPRWIRQLYRALPQMGTNNQFILTTHSPELRQLAAEDGSLIDLGALGDQRDG